jgi:hypothetical protein
LGFGCNCDGRVYWRSDDGHATADQIGQQRRQTIILAIQPVVFNAYVLSLDVAGFA